MNPLNQQLLELKRLIVHYEHILEVDSNIKNNSIENIDNRPLLSDDDIEEINTKLTVLRQERDSLLSQVND